MNYEIKETITQANYDAYVNEERKRVPNNFAELKAKYPAYIFLFLVGDFYEVYCDDAQCCAELLGLTLYTNPKGEYRLAGFSKNKFAQYLSALIRKDKRVAVIEKEEMPKERKHITEKV